MDIEIRGATSSDVKDIKKLLSFYYLDTDEVEKRISGFIVAVLDSKVAGCASLEISNVVELRSIAVLPHHRNKGIGSRLVDSIVNRIGQTDTIYLRTTSPVFFEKKGFKRLSNDCKKVLWKDCAQCDKFKICKQTPMRLIPQSQLGNA